MFIRQLEYFITLAKIKHFAKAAEICCVSQPALSIAIRNLEDKLGVSIIKRGKRYEGLTPEGEYILQYANQILALWKDMKQVAQITKIATEIRIGVIPTAMHIVPLITDAYRSSHLNVREQVQMMSMNKITTALIQYDIDIGIGYLNDLSSTGMMYLPLFKEKLMLLCRKNSEIAYRNMISWEDVAELPLCLFSNELQSRQQIDSAFKQANVKPNVVLETNSPITLFTHIISSGLYSIVPQNLGVFDLFSNLEDIALVDLTPPIENMVALISLDKEPRPPIVETLWEHAKSLENFFLQKEQYPLIRKQAD